MTLLYKTKKTDLILDQSMSPDQLDEAQNTLAPPPFQLKSTFRKNAGETQTPEVSYGYSEGGLPTQLKQGIEGLSGMNMGDVDVHYNSDKPKDLGANAYAQGTEIHIGPGQEKHLPHEAWHVVQQKQGRVKANMDRSNSIPINDDHALEKEADVKGAQALQMKNVAKSVMTSNESSGGVAQLSPKEKINEFSRKSGLSANIQTISSHFKMNRSEVHAIIASDDSYEQKIAKLSEPLNKEKVEAKESKDKTETGGSGGHAIGRHGPEIDDNTLKDRLFSGMAPDGALSPAPGNSSKFKSYGAMLSTRQSANAYLGSEIAGVQKDILKWKAVNIEGDRLSEIANKREGARVKKAKALQDAEANEQNVRAEVAGGTKEGTEIGLAVNEAKEAKKKLDLATENKKIADEEVAKPGKHLMRMWPSYSKFGLDIREDADAGQLEENVKLKDTYSFTIAHTTAVGEGFESDDGIKFSEIARAAATNPDAADDVEYQPKSETDIEAALSGLGVAGDLNKFAKYLSDKDNLNLARKKGGKGSKVFKSATATGDLTKTTTNIQTKGDKKLFDSNAGSKEDKPKKVKTADWPAIQHFPAAEDAEVGFK
ncbi:eCIS core domain-containing protein [Portibacter marinus]|uniref:eCIS core domain-containing protein n=1 Tax=Portibacter marinus TaxID=2898660 RepID=UPI001F4574A2|nr:DUF4157 domain-containing protein [Portibacter marinus]